VWVYGHRLIATARNGLEGNGPTSANAFHVKK